MYNTSGCYVASPKIPDYANSKWDLNQWKHTKTLKLSKRIMRFNSTSERLHFKILKSNCYISKSHQSLNGMLNLHGKFAEYVHKGGFYRRSVWILWNQIVVSHLPWKLENIICHSKVLIALQHTSFLFQGSGSPANWIKKVMSESNVHQYHI